MKFYSLQEMIAIKTLYDTMAEDGIFDRTRSEIIRDHLIWNSGFYINMIIIVVFIL
jgi:hypothetical protein